MSVRQLGELVTTDDAFLVALVELAGTIITSYVAVLVATLPIRRHASRAAIAAETAADQTTKTGDGFADHVTSQLDQIAARLDVLETDLTNHLERKNPQ